jgi:hypothetical protein
MIESSDLDIALALQDAAYTHVHAWHPTSAKVLLAAQDAAKEAGFTNDQIDHIVKVAAIR